MEENGEITKAQLFDLIADKEAEIWDQNIRFNNKRICGIGLCDNYPENINCYDHPEYYRDVYCIFESILYIAKEDVIDLLRGKSISIYNKQGIEVLTIKAEE